MAQLAAFLVSSDDEFRRDFGRLVRSGSIPIGIVDDARGPEHVQADLAFVDIRGDAAGGMGAIDRFMPRFAARRRGVRPRTAAHSSPHRRSCSSAPKAGPGPRPWV